MALRYLRKCSRFFWGGVSFIVIVYSVVTPIVCYCCLFSNFVIKIFIHVCNLGNTVLLIEGELWPMFKTVVLIEI